MYAIRSYYAVVVVDAVEDAEEVLAPLVEDPLEAVPVLRRLDLPAVGVADGREDIREDEPRLEQAQLPEELDPLRREQVPGEPGHREVVIPEQPLVSEIVDGEHRGRSGQRFPRITSYNVCYTKLLRRTRPPSA